MTKHESKFQNYISLIYPNNPVARIDIDSLDAVVNGKAKENEGKGYDVFAEKIHEAINDGKAVVIEWDSNLD